LFVQSRGALRKELTRYLRTQRSTRRPAAYPKHFRNGQGQIRSAVHISQRPAEAEDRAVPGHWEGDLIYGQGIGTVATLVERHSRFVMLVGLPTSHTAEVVADALAAKISDLPAQLRRSLTWDQGKEMAQHSRFTIASGVPVFFCDPRSPWQRGTNENTNGLLRQYLPRKTRLAERAQHELDAIAAELNGRPRQTLQWKTPAQALDAALP
jgi:IS30 family transposase